MGSTTMTAWAVTKVHSPLTKLTEEIPAPTGTEVLIKVTHCGVCHSDLHNWEGFYDMGDGKKLHLEDRTSLPVVLGHEVLGRVQSMGPEAAAMGLKEGDSRLVYPWIGCRNCDDCANDKDDLCMKPQSMGLFKKGGFSSHMIIPHPKYLVDYGNIAPEVACTFNCSGLAPATALKRITPIDPNEYVVLIGAGGLGLQSIGLLHAMGHDKIISVDIADDKLAAAKKAGATLTVNSSAGNGTELIKEAAGGPVKYIIDMVGSAQTTDMSFKALGKDSKLVVVGIAGGKFSCQNVDLIFKGITIYGNRRGGLQGLRDVCELAKTGKMGGLPVKTVPWENAMETLLELQKGNVTGRLVLEHPEKY